ncbi:MAG TPA: DUF3310 domain-containing protein [Anaerolineae bacterium]|nr:DUF3310 domain-containing protein [Anaerolineae bacterium]
MQNNRTNEDPVNRPGHYHKNGIEVIDVIETYAKSDFRLANVLKYVCRCEYKDNKLQDLKKAAWYLNRVIEEEARLEQDPANVEWTQVILPAERIAGDDELATDIKNEYYNHDPGEAIGTCRNPACRATIFRNEAHVQDNNGRIFCCTACTYMINRTP